MLALLIAASTMLPPAAHAAAVGSLTGTCRKGDFKGQYTLSFAEIDRAYRLSKVKAGAGPYIADNSGSDRTGSIRIKVTYFRNGSTITALNHTTSGLRSNQTVEFPVDSPQVPRFAQIEVRFSDSSGVRCVSTLKFGGLGTS